MQQFGDVVRPVVGIRLEEEFPDCVLQISSLLIHFVRIGRQTAHLQTHAILWHLVLAKHPDFILLEVSRVDGVSEDV